MYYGWKPYVPVARRRANAARAAKQLAKKRGRELQPIAIDGRKIARTFWGEAWCDSLENHSDFENRLPRGRTYVRNGSVIDLDIARGRIDALVSGSEIYTVKVEITGLKSAHWKQLKSECSESIDSLLDLLAGRFSDGVMRRLTDPERGLFPQPKEIKMSCSCPDWAVLCKHAAAVLYGVGARLDQEPQLLFLLRGVDHAELVSEAVSDGNLETALSGSGDALAGEDLGAMFGIELDAGAASETKADRGRRAASTAAPATKAKRAGKKKAVEQTAPVAAIDKPAAKKSRSAKKPAAAGAKRSGPPESKAVAPPAELPERKKPARRPRAVAS
ncbi:MAG TPA: SWIM zinc finger family protein [Pirellulales bacterium]|nr:SWIM zinc finger family protein [Pirellulales bacterium]